MAAEKKALESINHQAMKYIRQALSEICFGELILVAQDSRLIQIERNEKIRIQQNAPSCQRKAFEEKELSTTLFLLTDLGKTLVNSDRASFWFWDKRKHTVWTLAALGTDTIEVPENSGLVGASMMNNEILIMKNKLTEYISQFSENLQLPSESDINDIEIKIKNFIELSKKK